MRRYKYKKDPIAWDADLAYVVGVIASDGNLSSDRRHINVTSKDEEMVLRIKDLLKLKSKIGKKSRGGSIDRKYFFLQFSDVRFYDFLLSIGITPAKSKTLRALAVPPRYFPDFLRGCIDGDGSIGGFLHPESRLYQSRVRLASASPSFLIWIMKTIQEEFGVIGGSIYKSKKSVSLLSFGKNDARKILKYMYYKDSVPALKRKYLVAKKLLAGE